MSFRLRSRSLVFGSLLVVVLAACAQACGDDDNASTSSTADAGIATVDAVAPPPTSTPTQATGTIGTTGGKVETTTGSGIEIPAGALSGNTQITVAQSPTTTPPAGAVGTPFVFGPSGLHFSTPATAVIEFDPTKLPAGKTSADIVVMTADDGSTTFTALTTTVRDGTHVTAPTSHFSTFVAVIPGAVIDAGDDDSGSTDNGSDSGITDSGGGGQDAGTTNDAGSGGASDASTDSGGASDASTENDAGSGASDASTESDGGSGASDASDDAGQ